MLKEQYENWIARRLFLRMKEVEETPRSAMVE